jgi:hypothetical protein
VRRSRSRTPSDRRLRGSGSGGRWRRARWRIAFFYAVGTAAGGITGPLFFGKMIDSGSVTNVMIAFLVGAAVMAVGGIAELFLGVSAEGKELEDIAKPLTAREAEEGFENDGREKPRRDEATDQRQRAREARRSRGAYGPRRFRPGPGSTFHSPGMIGTAYSSRRAPERSRAGCGAPAGAPVASAAR